MKIASQLARWWFDVPPHHREQHRVDEQHHVTPVALVGRGCFAQRPALMGGGDQGVDAQIDRVLQIGPAGRRLRRHPIQQVHGLLDQASIIWRLKLPAPTANSAPPTTGAVPKAS